MYDLSVRYSKFIVKGKDMTSFVPRPRDEARI